MTWTWVESRLASCLALAAWCAAHCALILVRSTLLIVVTFPIFLSRLAWQTLKPLSKLLVRLSTLFARIFVRVLVWPAVSRSVEDYCYHVFLQKLSVAEMKQGKHGGWTQTSSAVSPLGLLLQAEAWRIMRSQCLNCGGTDHSPQMHQTSCRRTVSM